MKCETEISPYSKIINISHKILIQDFQSQKLKELHWYIIMIENIVGRYVYSIKTKSAYS
jgi:hypothetical protein